MKTDPDVVRGSRGPEHVMCNCRSHQYSDVSTPVVLVTDEDRDQHATKLESPVSVLDE